MSQYLTFSITEFLSEIAQVRDKGRAGIDRGLRTHGFHIFRHTGGSIVRAQTGDIKLAQVIYRTTGGVTCRKAILAARTVNLSLGLRLKTQSQSE